MTKNDCFYLFIDGYADQFGGPKNKKFKLSTLTRLLLENADQTMHQQQNILEQANDTWLGVEEQIDDICVLGCRIV